MTPTLEEIRARLTAAKNDLSQRYPIRTLAIFGSFARNEAGPDSDILVEFSKPVGFEVADLAFELEDLLGHQVDLVPSGAIRERPVKCRPYSGPTDEHHWFEQRPIRRAVAQ